jgi:hypothetical protein
MHARALLRAVTLKIAPNKLVAARSATGPLQAAQRGPSARVVDAVAPRLGDPLPSSSSNPVGQVGASLDGLETPIRKGALPSSFLVAIPCFLALFCTCP